MERSFEAVLVEQCAPTLAGVKPSNLFSFQSDNGNEVRETVSEWNRKLRPYGLSICILRQHSKASSFLIYIYRIAWLDCIISEQTNRCFLEQSGYILSEDFSMILQQLCDRLRMERQFPHEIGIFLGYPLCDVIGFIENKGMNFTCSGYWKSYSDPKAAQKCYERYRRCFSIYKRMFENGAPISRLIVAA